MLTDKIQKTNPSSRRALLIALGAVMALALYNWMIQPHAQYLFAVNKNKTVTRQKKETLNQLKTKLRIKTRELKNLRKIAQNRRELLFTPQKAREFLTSLQQTADKQNCTLYSLQLSGELFNNSPTNQKQLSQGIAALKLQGTYPGITEFIDQIQTGKKLVYIESFSLRPASNSNQFDCDLEITLYAQPNDSEDQK